MQCIPGVSPVPSRFSILLEPNDLTYKCRLMYIHCLYKRSMHRILALPIYYSTNPKQFLFCIIPIKGISVSLFRNLWIYCLIIAMFTGCTLQDGPETLYWREKAQAGLADILPPPSAHFEADRNEVIGDIREKDSLSLQDCYRLALMYNEDLALQGESYYQAILSSRIVLADSLPDLSFQGNYNKVEYDPGTGSSNDSKTRSEEYFLHLEQTLFEGFRNLFALRQANHEAESLGYLVQRERDLIFLAISRTFYATLQYKHTIDSRQNSVRVQEKQLARIEAEYEAGVARSSEVLLSKANLARDRADLATTQQDYQSARNSLSLLINWNSSQALEDLLTVPLDLPLTDKLIQKALASRPDLKAASEEIQASRQRINTALAQWAPEIKFSGNSWTHREGYYEDVDWEYRISGEISLFDGGVRIAELRQARSRHRQALQQCSKLQKQIRFEVDDLYGQLLNQQKVMSAADAQLDSASQAHTQVWAEYQQGEATNLEVITAENLLLAAEITLYREQLKEKMLWLELQVAMGEPLLGEQAK